MPRLAVAVLSLAGSALLMLLPAAAQDPAPVFRSETTLVEFNVVALDKNGDPVTDLRRDEVEVTDRGRPRDLAVFRYEGGEQPRTAPNLPPGMFTNTPELTPGPPRNVTAIVLDTFNTQPQHQTWIKAQAMRYLDALLPNTRVAVYLLGRQLTVVHDFTDDPESLRALIERTRVQQPGPALGHIDDMAREMETLIQRVTDENPNQPEMVIRLLEVERRAQESSNEQRTRQTLDSLQALGDHLAGVPGRKCLVWFGSGVTMLSINAGGIRSQQDLVRDASRRLAQQGITLYMFDARGMQVQADMSVERRRVDPSGVGQISPHERLKDEAVISANTVSAMDKFADITGGRVFWNTNDVGRAVDEISADTRGAYSLGFYSDGGPDDKWRNLKVRVSRKGVKLHHRNGYAMPVQEAPHEWTDEQWRAAVYNPVGSTAVRLDVRLAVDGGDGTQSVGMILQIATDDLRFRQVGDRRSAALDLAVVDKLRDGRFHMQHASREIPFPSGEAAEVGVVQVRHDWALTPGAVVVRLIARDRLTGRYGSLDAPVDDIPRSGEALGSAP